MSKEVNYSMHEDDGSNKVWKAVGIGLAVGVTAVIGTCAVVATHIAKTEDLSGAALITSTLAAIGGGSVESGGDGMVGGLINLCVAGSAGVIAGAASSVMFDAIDRSTNFPDELEPYL